jgi:hypothetical protein
MDFALPLGNDIFCKGNYTTQKTLIIKFDAQIQAILQIVFYEIKLLNVCSSLTKPSTWRLIISTNLINLKNLWLKMA